MTATHCSELLGVMLAALDNPNDIKRVNYTLRGIEAIFEYQGTEYQIILQSTQGETK